MRTARTSARSATSRQARPLTSSAPGSPEAPIHLAIGASCDFLTPFGHQNNTLILGPGGYRFGDFWKLGLPIDAIILAVAVPLLPIVFPFA